MKMKCFFINVLNFLIITLSIIVNTILAIPLVILFILFLSILLILNIFDKDKKPMFTKEKEEDFKEFLTTLNSKQNKRDYFKC